MDRTIIYPGQIPLETDLLSAQRNAMIGLAYLARAALGTATWVDGLALSPTAPASMTLNVAPGSIGNASTIDASAYSSLAADTNPLIKVGINTATTPLTFTAPATAGTSIIYLVEAAFGEADALPTTLPYYNAANPTQPFLGPAGAGTTQNTVRRQYVQLQVKTGTAASVPVAPTVDAGWSPLYLVTVPYGATTLTAANFQVHPAAPFIGIKVLDIPSSLRTRLQAPLTLYVATTGNDATGNGSSTAPFQTLQRAWNVLIAQYDLNGYTATINVANGTYTAGLVAVGMPPGASSTNSTSGNPANCIFIVGNPASPLSCTINVLNANCITAQSSCEISVSGITFYATGSQGTYNSTGCGLYAIDRGGIIFSNCVFANCTVHVYAGNGGFISTNGQPYTVAGSASIAHLYSSTSSYVTITNSVVTISGSPSTATYALASTGGFIFAAGTTFVNAGSLTGQRYSVTNNAVALTSGGGANFFPGSSAGVVGNGGQYS